MSSSSHLLQALIQSLQKHPKQTAYMPTKTPAQNALHQLSLTLPSETLCILHALAPRSTNTALQDMEAQTQTTSLSELVSDHGPHKWPRILSRLALLVATGEHMAVRVGGEPCPSASGNGGHVVIVGGIRLIEEEVTFDKKGSLGVNCDCKAFEFGVEPCCKHVIVALVAAVSKLAAITHVSEDEFVDMLEGNNSNKQ